ncbi:P-loop containing nucleoside triphosphate hydrolase protein, partial [Periconia macrospinosa]
EGVAQMFEKPLYQITCGDLGTTATEVEKALETSFNLASRWGCVLLLDEADVFLAERSRLDFTRNGLILVFLRVLEYYTGVLFLTTNRIGDFDEAFASRIHISLYYPQLDVDSTLSIFNLNLDMIDGNHRKGKIKIDREEVIKFATKYFWSQKEARWNGRQIRNACHTALALAELRAQGGSHKKVKDLGAVIHLKVDDLEIVSNAYLEFMKYLTEVH